MRSHSPTIPDCSRFAQCGGCPMMRMEHATQRAKKEALVMHALDSQSLSYPTFQCQGFGTPTHYRNRVRFKVHSEGQIGFFNPEKAVDCVVLTTDVRESLEALVHCAAAHPELFSIFEHGEIRGRDLDGRKGLYLTHREEACAPPPPPSVWATRLGQDWVISTDRDTEIADQRVAIHSNLYTYVALNSFRQVNDAVNQAIIHAIREGARKREIRDFLDLFCGAGNFALALAQDGLCGVAIEQNERSIEGARRAAAQQAIHKVRFQTGDARTTQTEASPKRTAAFDMLLLNPPRAGVGPTLATIAAQARRWVTILSCNPTSLARDLKVLHDLGFEIEEMNAFDMFPQTRHVETLVWCQRNASKSESEP